MVVLFAGYTMGSYGWVLLKGWDIPFRQWVSPLHPYEWPPGGADPPPIPPDRLFPSSKAGATGPSGGAGGARTSPGRATQPQRGASGAAGSVPVRTQ